MTLLGRWVVASLLITTVALLTNGAHASHQVLVVTPGQAPAATDATTGAVAQLRAELATAGFEVVTQTTDSPDSTRTLDDLARAANTFAAITVAPSGDQVAVVVWVTDRVSGKTLLRRVEAPQDGGEASRIVALRAVELLEASLIELDLPRPEPPALPPVEAKPPSTEPLPALAPQPDRPSRPVPGAGRKPIPLARDPPSEGENTTHHPRFGAALGAAGMGGPGGLGSAASPTLGFSVRTSPLFAVEVVVAGPVRAELEAEQGSAQVDQELGWVGLRLDPSPERRLSAFAAMGLGAYRLGGHGATTAPHSGERDSAWAPTVTASVAMRVRVIAPFAIVLRADGFLTAPRPTVRFAATPVARAPSPGLLAGAAGEVRF